MSVILSMQPRHARDVARIHRAAINHGVLCSLGDRFLAALYRGIVAHPDSAVWVAERDGQVVGFCAYTRNVSGMYKLVLRKKFLSLVGAAFPRMFRWQNIRRAWDVMRYAKVQRDAKLPEAEILSIALAPGQQGGGIGTQLLNIAVERARADGETKLKVMVGHVLDAARRFYERNGFTLAGEIMQHGDRLCIYVQELAPAPGQSNAPG